MIIHKLVPHQFRNESEISNESQKQYYSKKTRTIDNRKSFEDLLNLYSNGLNKLNATNVPLSDKRDLESLQREYGRLQEKHQQINDKSKDIDTLLRNINKFE
jgi:hypothetical protein